VAARDIKVEATDGGAALKAVDMQAERNFELSSAGNAAIVSDATEAANGSISQATSRIKAGNQANVTALGDLSVQGGDVQAKDINLIALGDVTLTGVQNKQVYGEWVLWTRENIKCSREHWCRVERFWGNTEYCRD
jgi:hypothetical protein